MAPGAVGELLVRQEGEDPRRGFFSGYYRDERGHRAGMGGRLVSHRRFGASRRGRVLFLRRPLEERDSPQRREHRRRRSRERAAGASRGDCRGGLSGARRDPGRGSLCLRRVAPGRLAGARDRGAPTQPLPAGARLFQVAGLHRSFGRNCRRPPPRNWLGPRSRRSRRGPSNRARPSTCGISSGAGRRCENSAMLARR